MAHYTYAPVLQTICTEIIKEYHPHLLDAKIVCLWRTDVWSKSDGRAVLGKSMVVPPIWRTITNYDLLVMVNKAAYDSMSDEMRISMLDNQLCYFKTPQIAPDDSLNYGLRLPDVVEFSEIVTRRKVCFSGLDRCLNLEHLDKIEFTHPSDKTETDPDIGWDEHLDETTTDFIEVEDYDERDDSGCEVKELVSFSK